jgi:TonB family protein
LRLAAMVATSPRSSTAHAIGIFDANILEKRIMTMNRAPHPCGWLMRFGLTTASMLMLAVTCSVAATRAFAVEPVSTSAANQTTSNGPVYKVGNGVSAPVVIHSVAAKYPKSYLNVKPPVDATVVVRAVVDKNGMPQDLRVIKSYVPAFDQEAIKAVDQFRFKPGIREGVPVAVAVTVEVNFRWY